MILHSLLAVENLQTYVLIAVIAVLAFAFLLGLSKGFRRVGKGGFYWVIAAGAFIFLYKLVGENNPLEGMLVGNLASLSGFVWAFLLVVACIVVTLILFGACAALFQPNVQRNGKKRENADGLEVDEEDLEDDKQNVLADNEIYYYRPGFFGRLFGGIFCVLNLLILVGGLALIALTLVQGTGLSAKLSAIYEIELLKKVLDLTSKYALDFATIGIIFAVACKGFRVGLIGTTFLLVRQLGILVAVVLGIVAPFVAPLSQIGFVQTVANKCAGLVTSLGSLSAIVGKVMAGGIFALALGLLVWLLSVGLRALLRNVEETVFIRVLDGVLATGLYFVLGLALCVLFWGLLYLLDYLGLFNADVLFNESVSFSKECFRAAEHFLKNFADTYLARFVKA